VTRGSNKSDAVNLAIASLSHAGHHSRGVVDPERYLITPSHVFLTAGPVLWSAQQFPCLSPLGGVYSKRVESAGSQKADDG
jgi:hypothetical protein